MHDPVIILCAAFLLDAAIGDPVYRLHPVRMIGRLASLLERVFFKLNSTGYIAGGVFLISTLAITVATYTALRCCLGLAHEWLVVIFDTFTLYSSCALKDLYHHARPIWCALRSGNFETARAAVQRIVGRDTSILDAHGIARAAVESIAESFVDGFFAPVFWFGVAAAAFRLWGADPILGGSSVALGYRTINTLDSMVGYRNARYQRFGCCSAKADDGLGYLPARLAVVCLFIAALLIRRSPVAGLKTWCRDRRKSPSPNAAQAESFAAGALGIRLGGPVTYPYGLSDKPWLGVGTPEVTPRHIKRCWHLVSLAGGIAIAICSVLLLLAYG